MKICLMTLVALFVACATSVIITGNYVMLQWYENGPDLFTFQVGGVVVYKPNDYAVKISTNNTFPNINIFTLIMDFNNMKYLPANYTRFFPSIQYLIVRNSHVKYVTNADFLGLWNLIHLDFQDNEIEHLPGNLFQNIPTKLQTVSFICNKITNVGPSFIANIPILQALFMKGNQCINLDYPVMLYTFTSTFKTNCQQPIIPDVETDLSRSLIIIDNLMAENANLTTEIILIEKSNNDLMKGIEKRNKLSLDLNKCKISSAKLRTELTKLRTKTVKSTTERVNKQTISSLNRTILS